MNSLLTKFAVCSISFAVGIATASLWSSYGPHATEKLDTIIVDAGARLLGSVSSRSWYNDVGPYERGRIEAARDIQNGMLKIKSLGLLTVTHAPYSELLMHNYGIEFIDFGCVETHELVEYIRGYNGVSKAAIERRYGEGILDRVFEQALKITHATSFTETKLPSPPVPPNELRILERALGADQNQRASPRSLAACAVVARRLKRSRRF